MNGIGISKWDDNKKYIGEYKDGKINGYGILKFNEKAYLGMWKDGKRHGFGVFVNVDTNK